jgi:hypothetical protein
MSGQSQMENSVSYGSRLQKVPCPAPTRDRHDDQIVEIFLNIWQEGRFANDPHWLPQDQTNVEVISTDENGVRLAVEHTRIYAFEGGEQTSGHQHEEQVLRPVAEALERQSSLDVEGRTFKIWLYPNQLSRVSQRSRSKVLDKILAWAAGNLPRLAVRPEVYRLEVPISSLIKGGLNLSMDVTVAERYPGEGPVSVAGRMPDDPHRLSDVLRKRLSNKLPKLVGAGADRRLLLLELPILESEQTVVNLLESMEQDFPLLDKVDHLVVADTFGFSANQYVVFWVRVLGDSDWSEILEPIFSTSSTAAPVP